jgi:hypothetical protein
VCSPWLRTFDFHLDSLTLHYPGRKKERNVTAGIVSNIDSLFDSTNSGDPCRARIRYFMTQRLRREETFDQGHCRGHGTSTSWCP